MQVPRPQFSGGNPAINSNHYPNVRGKHQHPTHNIATPTLMELFATFWDIWYVIVTQYCVPVYDKLKFRIHARTPLIRNFQFKG